MARVAGNARSVRARQPGFASGHYRQRTRFHGFHVLGSVHGLLRVCDRYPEAAGLFPRGPYNLVSFHYDGTNLLSAFTITQSDAGFSIGGMIPTSLAAWADFNISASGGMRFSSDENGVWAAGPFVAPSDYGTAGLWNGETEAVPEPGAFLLVAGGIAVIGVRRWTVRT